MAPIVDSRIRLSNGRTLRPVSRRLVGPAQGVDVCPLAARGCSALLVLATAFTGTSCSSRAEALSPAQVEGAAQQWADGDPSVNQYPDRRVACSDELPLKEGASTNCDIYSSINRQARPMLGVSVVVIGVVEGRTPALAFSQTTNPAFGL